MILGALQSAGMFTFFISFRKLIIYLQSNAFTKVLSLFGDICNVCTFKFCFVSGADSQNTTIISQQYTCASTSVSFPTCTGFKSVCGEGRAWGLC